MEKISSIIGKPVISIFDGNLEGYIKNVYVDKNFKKIRWLCVFDNETEEEKLISTKSIYNVGFDAIMIKNSSQTYPMDSIDIDCINPIGFKIYKASGKETGKVTDFYYDEKFNAKSLFINNQTIYDTISILKVGKNLIIEKETDAEKLCNFGPKKINEIKPLSNQKVTIQTEKNHTELPTKILTSGYNFLIGRKVGQNIYAENGSVIAKKQSTITQTIIDMASKNGRLNDLTKYSLV